VRGRLHLFSTRHPVERGAFLRDGRLVLRTEHGEEDLLDRSGVRLPGEHNASNALAAALAARLSGCAPGTIAAGLRAYRPLPHRLQHVATIRGVAFFDDSKATNPASAARALEAFDPGSVHVLLGGRDKGGDWSELAGLLRRQARRVLLVGEAATVLRERLAGTVPLVDCGTVRRALAEGLAGARPGEVVLLAPGCASFDQYRNYAERGEDFQAGVRELARGETAGA
jgi:UDP-N-acetylmuramoylalanine--D-glutamate ligase